MEAGQLDAYGARCGAMGDDRLIRLIGLMQMPKFVRIAHRVNGGDLALLDFECGRLQLAVRLEPHEGRRPEGVRPPGGIPSAQAPHLR